MCYRNKQRLKIEICHSQIKKQTYMRIFSVSLFTNQPPPPSLSRGTADWFGVSKDSDSTQRWRRKSLQHCSHLYGGLKPQVMREMELHSQDNLSLASTETPPPLYLPPHHHTYHHHYGMQRVGQRHVRNMEEQLSPFPPTLFLFIEIFGACFNSLLCHLD